MNPEYTDIEFIDRYLKGQLTSEELSNFEKRLQEDSSFSQQYKAQKLSDELLEDYELLQIKKQMQLEMPKLSSGSNNNFLYAGAALLVASGLATYVLFNTDKTTHTEQTKIVSADTVSPSTGKNKTIPSEDKIANYSDAKTISKDKGISSVTKVSEKPSDIVVKANDKTELQTDNIIAEVTKTEPDTKPGKDSVSKGKNCSELVIENSITTGDACEGKNNGYVKIAVIRGGTAPYSYKIKNKTSFTASDKFEYLSAGDYYVSIKESSGCIYQVKNAVTVSVKTCEEPFNTTFTPGQEPFWKLPIKTDLTGKMKIQDKAGRIVHEIVIHNGQPSEWDGFNYKGEETPAGYYYVTIETLNGTMSYGYLTINR
jgi:hypothetical protein